MAARRPASRRARRTAVGVGALLLALAGCAAPVSEPTTAEARGWDDVLAEADGQTVRLWMYGGDDKGNAYVDDVLAPAAAEEGVTLERVPIADTGDAVNRVLSERQAGVTDGEVDLIWINGENFATGQQAGAWLCDWTSMLPNMEYVDPEDPLLTTDFGLDVNGCEAPWHKAQFALVYDEARVEDPPGSVDELLTWIEEHPGRFSYPAPPDFTGSVFVRQVLYSVAGGVDNVPLEFSQDAYDELAPELFGTLEDIEPSLWREGQTYPQSLQELDQLYADGQVDFTMTYGPATLPDLVEEGTFPPTTRVLLVEDGTIGNASFLAVPSTSGSRAGAMVVANLALSPEQQLAKARPEVWGQYTVLDPERLPGEVQTQFAELPQSEVLPSYAELSEDADPEVEAGWVTALDEGWRRQIAAG
ncbi:putative spermidine/putrescine transport system substrate-binding protein [Blastococcus colisei]|uniref:Putative spermidine/putrescine transport system substrate-binding protein n=1 Tax=Blastococcus colisei TaxID=1564162 RepID=A0A543PA15_9ACTN|nr:ABC transporter substrate-binding protein [Blastococcus colisei]TQN40924.1 putative spermidine/putrescine transport system substrate-binding protein [Blastococcus colisei]